MAETKNSEERDYDEFVKAIGLTHGRADNETIYNLISNYGCTAEDVERVANKTRKADFLNHTLSRYNRNYKAVLRTLNKMLYSSKRSLSQDSYCKYTFGDYGWYFKNVQEDAKTMPILMNKIDVQQLFDNGKEQWGDATLSLYTYNYGVSLLERDNYPSKLLYDRFKGTEEHKEFMYPYNLINLQSHYDLSVVWARTTGRFHDSNLENYMSNYRYNYDTQTSGRTSRTVQKRLAEQAVQLDVLCSVMKNELYTPEELSKGVDADDKNIINYCIYLLSRYRKTGTRRHNHPETATIELFSQVKTLEMLLGMGLGIKCKTKDSWILKNSNKKLNKRIQTAYKTFVKAKTVDDRKAMRGLLKDQANILINDFMGGSSYFECVELNCVKEQDEAFESGAPAMVTKATKSGRARTVVSTPNAPVVKKSFDLSKLASATTSTVEKGRN